MTYEKARKSLEIAQQSLAQSYKAGSHLSMEINRLAIEALEKQIPKKPKSVERHLFECPCCKDDLGVSEDDIFIYEIPTLMYCSNCGQALDWSDEYETNI